MNQKTLFVAGVEIIDYLCSRSTEMQASAGVSHLMSDLRI